MGKIKLLLYCTKQKPTLYNVLGKYITYKYLGKDFMQDGKTHPELNGKIVAECDYEVEEIRGEIKVGICECGWISPSKYDWCYNKDFLDKSCLTNDQVCDYLDGNTGYAIHIKNLHIFDKPRELSEYTTRKPKNYETMMCDSCMANIDCKQCSHNYEYHEVMKAPQNMMKVCEWDLKDYILISIHPEWLCKILNGEKAIEVRKKVLKEML